MLIDTANATYHLVQPGFSNNPGPLCGTTPKPIPYVISNYKVTTRIADVTCVHCLALPR